MDEILQKTYVTMSLSETTDQAVSKGWQVKKRLKKLRGGFTT
jgi:hypothetical protein